MISAGSEILLDVSDHGSQLLANKNSQTAHPAASCGVFI